MFDKAIAVSFAVTMGIITSGVVMFPLLLWGNMWMRWLWVIVMLAISLYIYLLVRPNQHNEWWG